VINSEDRDGTDDVRWSILIDVSRQGLYAVQAGDPEQLNAACIAYRDVVSALQRASPAAFDVNTSGSR
jgi:hypothetical protein